MTIVTLFSWWYGLGWLTLMRKVGGRIKRVLDFFSVGLLLGSLFDPFRQFSTDSVQGSLTVQLRAWGDKQFSRIIGAIVRLILIFVGLASALLVAVFGLVLIVAWPLLPLAPVFGWMLGWGSSL